MATLYSLIVKKILTLNSACEKKNQSSDVSFSLKKKLPLPLKFIYGKIRGHVNQNIMKKEIHPDYHKVVFYDTSSDHKFLTQSTMTSEETTEWEDGNSYPLIKVEVSSASHPFYTGKKLYVDTAGRVEKFNRRYKNKKPGEVKAEAPEQTKKE